MTTQITVVTSPGCHYCDDARSALAEIDAEFPLSIDHIAATDPRGADLVRAFRPAMFPLILVEGRWFSSGRLPRGKLRALLAKAEVA